MVFFGWRERVSIPYRNVINGIVAERRRGGRGVSIPYRNVINPLLVLGVLGKGIPFQSLIGT